VSEFSKLKIVFWGSTKFGGRCLQTLFDLPGFTVVGAVTTPQIFPISYRPAGVTNFLYADIATLCNSHNVPLFKIKNGLGDPDLISALSDWAPELMVVVGWYHRIPKTILKIAPAVGLHASLLPDYSGGAPLVWAIINGEEKTGITLFRLGDGIDNGDILAQKEEPILLNDNICTLYSRIEDDGIELIRNALPAFSKNEISFIKQDESVRRVMPQRGPEDGRIDWTWSPLKIYNFIRAQTKPYPGAFTSMQGRQLYVWEAKLFDAPISKNTISVSPGTIIEHINEGPIKGFLISTRHGDHPLLLTQVGLDRDELLPALEFANKHNISPVGSILV